MSGPDAEVHVLRVLIAGCGYVGCALGSELAADGHEVFGLRRNPEALPPEITGVAADLSRKLQPDALPSDLDFVFYTASAGGADDDAYRSAYVDGPANLIAALSASGTRLRRFLFTSSTGVYAQKNGEWVDENSPTEPETYSGRRLLEGERRVLGSSYPTTVLRLAGIYGPGRTRSIERGLEVAADGAPAYTNRIHRDDCAGVLRHLMLLPEPEPLYLGVDHEPAEKRVVAEWLSARLGVPVRGRPSSGSARARTNKRCSNARLVATGYEFRYPTFREGFVSLLGG